MTVDGASRCGYRCIRLGMRCEMPRPNPPRSIAGEKALARRIAMERDNRGWTYDGLASRMTEAGCPIQPSAIYKIEKADPPRRITVDELLGFSAAFELAVPDLLRPREVVVNERLSRLFDKWEKARQEERAAQQRNRDAFEKIAQFVQKNHGDALEPFYQKVKEWAAATAPSDTEAEMLRTVVITSALPVEALNRVQWEAIRALVDAKHSEEDSD
jgi:transcriptional regulator with XRE-family HTH domain